MAISCGPHLLKKIADALGITVPVQKIVIEATVGGVVRVYVRSLLTDDKEGPLVGALKEVVVGDAGDVTTAVEDVFVTDQADVIVVERSS